MTLAPAPAAPLAAFDVLDGIGLDDLNASAALLTRVDRKYLLSPARLATRSTSPDDVLAALLDEVLLPDGARVLEIDGRRAFGYRSDYLDTPDDASFRGAAHRRRRRFKVRLRTYLDTGTSTLEVKTRGGRGTTVKERAPFDGDVLTPDGRLSPAAAAYTSATLRDAHIVDVDVATLRTSLTTLYHRTTVLLPTSGARLTLDAGLQFVAADGVVRDTPGLVVVETKTPTGVRADADRFLWGRGVRPARFSKYATGRALMDDTLPANRWHRAIDRDLALPDPTFCEETR